MNRRDVVRTVMEGGSPAYVPWQISLTGKAREKLLAHCGLDADGLDGLLDNHCLSLGGGGGFFTNREGDLVRDYFGVTWDRSVDRDIGVVAGQVLPEPTLAGYSFPDPENDLFFQDIVPRIQEHPDRYRIFHLGFSVFERAWTLRGMSDLLMDFYLNPEFVRELFARIVDFNLAMVRKALKSDIDCVLFGDDWGQQHGLIMGYPLWREFLYPELKRMYQAVLDGGRTVAIHSCGDVDELFDDLVGIGVRCFNPFQPEVMDTHALMRRYRGRLSFFGGLSTQRTLPYGTPAEVVAKTRALLAEGIHGGLMFSPAHSIPGDVPAENMLAFLDELKKQPGFRG